jgi:nitrous oxidase accessory protein
VYYFVSKEIYVPNDYLTIQQAVDNASEGDVIIVRDGTYVENVKVSKRLTIRSENGSESTIVRAENSHANVFDVTMDYVNLSGVTVEGATGWHPNKAGIYLNANYCTFSNNTCSNNGYGILSSHNNLVIGNKISFNGWNGIRFSSNNTIVGNYISNNGQLCESPLAYSFAAGIYLDSSNNSIINNTLVNDGLYAWWGSTQNEVRDNTVNGKPLVYLEDESDKEIKGAGQVILLHCNNISVENSDLSHTLIGVQLLRTNNCKITKNNICSNNVHGICLDDHSLNNSIRDNNINSNNQHGIYLRSSTNNKISNSYINSNNMDGICLFISSNNTISDNNINTNDRDGISFFFSSNNSICANNFVNNTENVYSSNSTNIWYSTLPMQYTYEGRTFSNHVGNYWSEYKGSDADKDGIGDTSYSIDSDKDNYPLMLPFENYFAPVENIVDYD